MTAGFGPFELPALLWISKYGSTPYVEMAWENIAKPEGKHHITTDLLNWHNNLLK